MGEMTIKKIAEYLGKIGLHSQVDRENERILVPFSGNNGSYLFVIQLQRSNDTLVIVVPNLAKAGENLAKSQLSELLEALLNINYMIAIGCFERDSSDGEIRFRVGIPTEDGGPSLKQFQHSFMVALATVDRYYPEIQKTIYGERAVKTPEVTLP